MKSFILGTIFGLILATVGIGGLSNILDNSVSFVKETTQELAQEKP